MRKERVASFPQIERVLFSLGLFYLRDFPAVESLSQAIGSHKHINESESNITHLIRVIHLEIVWFPAFQALKIIS